MIAPQAFRIDENWLVKFFEGSLRNTSRKTPPQPKLSGLIPDSRFFGHSSDATISVAWRQDNLLGGHICPIF